VVASETVTLHRRKGTALKTVHCLKEQYRMHECICKVVSTQFYADVLRTPPQIRDDRASVEKQPSSPSPLYYHKPSMSIHEDEIGPCFH
jgi:hypothetical protein